MHLKCVLQHRLSAVRSNALSHRRAPGSNSRGSSTEHRLSLLHFHSLHYTANSWRPRGRSWVFTCVCVCVCVCAWVLREGFGPNWHRHVKCSREPSWHSCTSKSPRSRQTERRMNANKSADPWVTFSIPALQAMRMETGGLEGYKISLLKWTYKKKKHSDWYITWKWLLGGRKHLNPNKVTDSVVKVKPHLSLTLPHISCTSTFSCLFMRCPCLYKFCWKQ